MILAILQARMSSSRLPGKVLKPILGQPMLALQIERIKRAKKIDKIILATSTQQEDEALVALARSLDIAYCQGSLQHVLERFYQAALPYQPEHIVRLTGDCPVVDPELIDQLIEFYLQGDFDYVALDPQFPDGLDVEIMSWQVLREAYTEAALPSEQEHVTFFIKQRPERYHLGIVKSTNDYSNLRWTVDEQKDFELIQKIYEALYLVKPNFSWEDVLNLVNQHPHLKNYNIEYKRNEGLQTSLLKDQLFLRGKHESL